MASNDDYLYNHLIRAKHIFDGAEQTTGIKIWASNERFPITSTKRAALSVNWNGFFSAGCNPVVNVTVGRRDMNRLWTSVKGPGASNWPDAHGCEIHAVLDPDAPYNLTNHMPIHILAVGY